jgi:hypothetical protein
VAAFGRIWPDFANHRFRFFIFLLQPSLLTNCSPARSFHFTHDPPPDTSPAAMAFGAHADQEFHPNLREFRLSFLLLVFTFVFVV